ncbi:MAG: TetR family transcriptional regulator [Sphingomonadales bacterium]
MARRRGAISDETATTRARLLDAAERLFAARGFDATTTREIAREADVPLGLMSYHFGTKDDLYAEVIGRRAEQHVADIMAAMTAVKQRAAGGEVDLRALVEAFFRPIAEKALHGGPGWRAYIRLLSRTANESPSHPHVAAFRRIYNPVPLEFIRLLRERFPAARPENIYWAHYVMTSSIIHMLVQTETLEQLSGGLCSSSDLDTVAEKMALLFEAGIERLARI